ncbi:hypothetical protein QVD17_07327 [Tagetes erecta]|uniref:Uncharacterized protein n=1 Tax=Tagetes erecta TaxID=13708 RepID=A0AAD8PC01_TARER|nr:hypothetical protein QVD17_07327 [Tagetes erecta]
MVKLSVSKLMIAVWAFAVICFNGFVPVPPVASLQLPTSSVIAYSLSIRSSAGADVCPIFDIDDSMVQVKCFKEQANPEPHRVIVAGLASSGVRFSGMGAEKWDGRL